MNPTLGARACSGDDFVRICGPDEWFWLLIMIGDEGVDGGLESDDAFEDATFEAAFGEDGEEDGVDGLAGRDLALAPRRVREIAWKAQTPLRGCVVHAHCRPW